MTDDLDARAALAVAEAEAHCVDRKALLHALSVSREELRCAVRESAIMREQAIQVRLLR